MGFPYVAKVRYTVTAADVLAQFISIPVLWRTPIFGDYVVSWNFERGTNVPFINDYEIGETFNVNPNGFTAVIQGPSAQANDILIVHAMAHVLF